MPHCRNLRCWQRHMAAWAVAALVALRAAWAVAAMLLLLALLAAQGHVPLPPPVVQAATLAL